MHLKKMRRGISSRRGRSLAQALEDGAGLFLSFGGGGRSARARRRSLG